MLYSDCLFLAEEGQPNDEGNLKNKDEGNTETKFPVLCLVVPYLHPKQSTDAATEEG